MRQWWNDLYSKAVLNESIAGYDPRDKRKPTRTGFVLMTLALDLKTKWINFACFHFGHKPETELVDTVQGAMELWVCKRCGTGGTNIWRR